MEWENGMLHYLPDVGPKEGPANENAIVPIRLAQMPSELFATSFKEEISLGYIGSVRKVSRFVSRF